MIDAFVKPREALLHDESSDAMGRLALWVSLGIYDHLKGHSCKLVIRVSSGHQKIKIIGFVKYATFA